MSCETQDAAAASTSSSSVRILDCRTHSYIIRPSVYLNLLHLLNHSPITVVTFRLSLISIKEDSI